MLRLSKLGEIHVIKKGEISEILPLNVKAKLPNLKLGSSGNVSLPIAAREASAECIFNTNQLHNIE